MKGFCLPFLTIFMLVINASIISTEENCLDIKGLTENVLKWAGKSFDLIKAKCANENPSDDESQLQYCVNDKVKKNLKKCENGNYSNRKEFADCFYDNLNVTGLKRMPFADYKRVIMKFVIDKTKEKLISHAIDDCNNLPQGLFVCSVRKLATGPCPELKKTFMYVTTSEEAED